jgi:hypothetical protein
MLFIVLCLSSFYDNHCTGKTAVISQADTDTPCVIHTENVFYFFTLLHFWDFTSGGRTRAQDHLTDRLCALMKKSVKSATAGRPRARAHVCRSGLRRTALPFSSSLPDQDPGHQPTLGKDPGATHSLCGIATIARSELYVAEPESRFIPAEAAEKRRERRD